MTDVQPEIINLRNIIKAGIVEHADSATLDGSLYNGTTGLAIMAGAAATILANLGEHFTVWASVCSGIATVVIALGRTLNFGERWRFHRRLRYGFQSLDDRISRYLSLSGDENPAELKEIYSKLDELRAAEADIPGITGSTN